MKLPENSEIMLKLMARRRRTHQSGPLGELFDHGINKSLNGFACTLLTRNQVSTHVTQFLRSFSLLQRSILVKRGILY